MRSLEVGLFPFPFGVPDFADYRRVVEHDPDSAFDPRKPQVVSVNFGTLESGH